MLPGALAARVGFAQERVKPNVIMVLVDDLGYADFSCYGGTAKTPNVDRLASEGLRFTQYYTNSPICSPSRTALTTGQYPARWKITSYIDNRALNQQRGMAQFLDPKAPTLARSLKAAGYATGHFGKWHLGGGRDVGEAPLPTEYGYDESLTQFEGLGDRLLPLTDDRDGMPPKKLGLGVASEKLGRGKVTWVDRAEVTKGFVDAALGFMKKSQAAGKPFFLNLWPDDVHSPFFPPKELRGDGTKRSLYEGVLVNMDRQLGVLFDAVRDDPKLRANTLVLVMSDNGPEQGAGSAGSFRGSKGGLYEGGIREPLIVWAPGMMPSRYTGATVSEAVVSAVDLVPSVMKLARATAPAGVALDGVDVSETLLGGNRTGRTTPLYWSRPPDRPGPPRNPLPDLAVRDGKWKLVMRKDAWGVRLYDLSADPAESKDLAAEQPEVAERLRKQLEAWEATLPKGGG